jgi:hypothetical protein
MIRFAKLLRGMYETATFSHCYLRVPNKQRFRVLRLGHLKDTNLLMKSSNLEIVVINKEGVPEFGSDGEINHKEEGSTTLAYQKDEVGGTLVNYYGFLRKHHLKNLSQLTNLADEYGFQEIARVRADVEEKAEHSAILLDRKIELISPNGSASALRIFYTRLFETRSEGDIRGYALDMATRHNVEEDKWMKVKCSKYSDLARLMNMREHQEAAVDGGFFTSKSLEAVELGQRVRISRRDMLQNQIAIVNSWNADEKKWVVSLVNPDLLVDAPAGEILLTSEDIVILGSEKELPRMFPSQVKVIESTDCVICLEKLNLNLGTVAPGVSTLN